MNADADKLSKYTDVGDWQITPIFFTFLNSKWGPFTIDRFASSQNRKLPRFNSKFFCPESAAVNAFLQNWECENNLLVPPAEDILRLVRYISGRRVRGTLVIPFWECAVYWPILCAGNNTFCYFNKDYMIFEGMDSAIIPGSCPFSVIGSSRMKGGIIALKIEFQVILIMQIVLPSAPPCRRLRSLYLEIFKTLHDLNPSFMKAIFQIRTSNYSSRNPNNLTHYRPNQVTFGTNSFKSLGPRIWNCLPEELKSANSLNIFNSLITQWNGPTCNCNACRFIVNIV